MQHLARQDVPEDFRYFRTYSPTYLKYLQKGGLKMIDAGNGQFGWLKNVL